MLFPFQFEEPFGSQRAKRFLYFRRLDFLALNLLRRTTCPVKATKFHLSVYSGQSEPLNPVQSESVIPAQSEPPFRV
jgi:hypothetical protein